MVSSGTNAPTARSRQTVRGGVDRAQRRRNPLPVPVVLYLLAVFLPLNFNVGPLAMNGVRGMLLLVIIPLTINLFLGRYGRILWADIFFFLHMLWAAVAIGVNNPSLVLQNAGSTSIEFIGGYVLARAYIRTLDDANALTRALIVMVICSLPFALYEAQTGRPILLDSLNKLPGFSSLPDVIDQRRMGLFRTQVFFSHPIHYGIFCTLALSLTFVGLKGTVRNRSRILFSLLIMLGVFLSLSSGALLAAGLQIALVVWAYALKRVNAKWLILGALAIVAYIAIDLFSNRTPLQVFISYMTFSAHNASWRSIVFDWGMMNLWGSPIFGIGLNDWVRPDWMMHNSVDNFWLLVAMRYGFPGVILLLLGFIVPIVRIALRDVGPEGSLWQYRQAWVITFAGLTFSLATVAVWTTAYSFVFFLFGSGMWLITAQPDGGNPTSDASRRFETKRTDMPGSSASDAEPATENDPIDAGEKTRYTRFPPR